MGEASLPEATEQLVTQQKRACAEHLWFKTASLLNMAARRGAKANMANTGPPWLKNWTFPMASGECMGFWERTFKQKACRSSLSRLLGLLTSWPLGLLASRALALLHPGGSGRGWDYLRLRPLMVGSHLPGVRVPHWDVCFARCQSLGCYNPVQPSTWVLDCFHSLALRAAHGD